MGISTILPQPGNTYYMYIHNYAHQPNQQVTVTLLAYSRILIYTLKGLELPTKEDTSPMGRLFIRKSNIGVEGDCVPSKVLYYVCPNFRGEQLSQFSRMYQSMNN